jgi:hypothetical protein
VTKIYAGCYAELTDDKFLKGKSLSYCHLGHLVFLRIKIWTQHRHKEALVSAAKNCKSQKNGTNLNPIAIL